MTGSKSSFHQSKIHLEEDFYAWLKEWHYKPQGKFARVGSFSSNDIQTLTRGNLATIWTWIFSNIKPTTTIDEIRGNLQLAHKKRAQLHTREHRQSQCQLQQQQLIQELQELDRDLDELYIEWNTLDHQDQSLLRAQETHKTQNQLHQSYYAQLQQHLISTFDSKNIEAAQSFDEIHGNTIFDQIRKEIQQQHTFLEEIATTKEATLNPAEANTNPLTDIGKILQERQQDHLYNFIATQHVYNKTKQLPQYHPKHDIQSKVEKLLEVDAQVAIATAALRTAAQTISRLNKKVAQDRLAREQVDAKLEQVRANETRLAAQRSRIGELCRENYKTLEEFCNLQTQTKTKYLEPSFASQLIQSLQMAQQDLEKQVIDETNMVADFDIAKLRQLNDAFRHAAAISDMYLYRIQDPHDVVNQLKTQLLGPTSRFDGLSTFHLLHLLEDQSQELRQIVEQSLISLEENGVPEEVQQTADTIPPHVATTRKHQTETLLPLIQQVVANAVKIHAKDIPELEICLRNWWDQPAQYATDYFREKETMAGMRKYWQTLNPSSDS